LHAHCDDMLGIVASTLVRMALYTEMLPFPLQSFLFVTMWHVNPDLWAIFFKQTQQLRKQNSELIAASKQLRRQNSELIAVAGVASAAGMVGVARAANKKFIRGKRILQQKNETALPITKPYRAQPHTLMLASGGTFVCGLAAAASAPSVLRRKRPCLHHHVRREVTPNSVRRVVEIECPGAARSGITVRVPPQMNGAVVHISRSAALGRQATMWRKQFMFPWKEGMFECRQEEMQLEHGVLRLTFEAELKCERLLYLPPPWTPQVFDFAGGDIPTPPSLPSSDGRTLEDDGGSVASHLQVRDKSSHHCQDAAEKEGQEETEEKGEEKQERKQQLHGNTHGDGMSVSRG